MAKEQKKSRTMVEDIGTDAKPLSASEIRKVKGGAKGINDIKIGLGKQYCKKCLKGAGECKCPTA